MVPPGHPSRASCAAMVMVELTLPNQSICRPGRRPRTSARSMSPPESSLDGPLESIDAAIEINRRGRVRDGSGGNEIGASLGVPAHIRKRDAAGDFGFGAARDEPDFFRGLLRCHIVQQET